MKHYPRSVTLESTRPHRVGETGFTLVEVMVAIAILSLIMLTTVTALRTLGNTQATIERLTNRVDEVRSVSTFLRDLFESAVVASAAQEFALGATSGSEHSYFVFGEDFLELKTTVLFGERYGGSYLIRVAKEGAQLVLRWQEPPVDRIVQDWAEMPSRVMVENLEEFAVATRKEYTMEWSGLRSEDDLSAPALVRLRLKSAGRYWPDLILQMQR